MLPSAALKEYAIGLGFDSVGVCAPVRPPHYDAYAAWIATGHHGTMSYLERHLPVKADPALLLPGVRSIIAVTLNYNQPNPPVDGQPRIARYALGRDYHQVLKRKLNALAKWLDQSCGGDIPVPDSAKPKDFETGLRPVGDRNVPATHRICIDSVPILERDYAQQAGLGWFGKNTMLIDSRRGSWFFIGLLLTTLELERDRPAVGGCGTCTKCIDACPTGAIVHEDGRWQVDARRCISYLTIEHEGAIEYNTAGWTFGCDVCQEVCPFNEPRASQPLRGAMTRERDLLARREWPSLQRLRVIGHDDWDRLTRGSAVRRAGFEGLKRNAMMTQ